MSGKSLRLKMTEKKKPYGHYNTQEAAGPSSSSSAENRTSASLLRNVDIADEPKTWKEVRLKRLMKEFMEIQKIENSEEKPIMSASLVDNDLSEWYIRLHVIDADSLLAKDMEQHNVKYILLHIVFPSNYPFSPPFMRVVEPLIEKGYVLGGGAICMEILTPLGWASTYTVEALIVQFSASLVKGNGRIASTLEKNYNKRAAKKVFDSVVKTHEKYGWNTPDLSEG